MTATIRTWSPSAAVADQVLFETPLDDPWSLTFFKAQGRALLAALMEDHVHLLDPSSGRPWRYPRQPWQPWHAAATIRDVEILAILDGDGVRIHALATGEPTLPPIEIPGTPNGIAFGRLGDRDLLLTAHFATIRVWNPRTGRKVAELPFGTKISGMSVHQAADDSILVAVGGPGIVVVELREVPSCHRRIRSTNALTCRRQGEIVAITSPRKRLHMLRGPLPWAACGRADQPGSRG
jgi:hypothetical protein